MKSFAFFRSFHCLYITYDGLLDPLGQTQILPYIFALADDGFRFTILSFEKLDRDPQAINHLYCQLQRKNINWIHLPFVRGRFQGLFRILRGAKAVHQISMEDPFAIAHVLCSSIWSRFPPQLCRVLDSLFIVSQRNEVAAWQHTEPVLRRLFGFYRPCLSGQSS